MAYQVELIKISKAFGGVRALKDVTLRAKAGEIHALVGENGAGKSTLMKILSGAYARDSGRILIGGTEHNIRNTLDSKKLGISIIYQEFSLVPDLTVAENIYLHQLGAREFWIRRKEMEKRSAALLNSVGFDINPSFKVRRLSVAQQQMVEIAKALSEKAGILILDEPSAVLGPIEVKKLFKTLFLLKNEGVAIIYITHHLDEVFEIADRVSVLKDGTSGESVMIKDTSRDALIRQMLGRSLDTMYPSRTPVIGMEILKTESLRAGDKVRNVSISVREGEVVGLAGLVGSGRTESMRALFGAERPDGGRIFLGGRPMQIKSPAKAMKAGIGMVPEDRKQHGIILALSVRSNLSLTVLGTVSDKLGFIKGKMERSKARSIIQKLDIRTRNEDEKAGNLSGGNQQKVAMAKWMSRENRVMIIDEPTRGVDVGAKVEIYKVINELASRGVGLIVVSSETSELMGICDRIIVMRKGEVQGMIRKEDFSEENILRMSLGA